MGPRGLHSTRPEDMLSGELFEVVVVAAVGVDEFVEEMHEDVMPSMLP